MRPYRFMLLLLTLLAASAALAGCGKTTTKTITKTVTKAATSPTTPIPTGTTAPAINVDIKSDEQHGRKGPDGQWHDAFVPADYQLKAHVNTVVNFRNFDDAPHSFTIPELHVDVTIPGAKGSAPGTASTVLEVDQTGNFVWHCVIPCDDWAMVHTGYMMGKLQVV